MIRYVIMTNERSTTPAARALVGCLALSDGATLNNALRLAGYETHSASPVWFHRARCYRANHDTWRVVVRDGRIVRVSRSANELTAWMFRLAKRLSGLQLRRAA